MRKLRSHMGRKVVIDTKREIPASAQHFTGTELLSCRKRLSRKSPRFRHGRLAKTRDVYRWRV